MKAKIILAEAVTNHPDGTTSMLRAGLTHVWADKTPVPLRGALYVRIEADMGDEGTHQFDLRCLDEDGHEVIPKTEGQFQVSQGGGSINLVLGLSVAFNKFGPFEFVLRIDNVLSDTWRIKATNTSSPSAPKGESN